VGSYLSLLFHWSSHLFLCQYYAVFIAMALKYSLSWVLLLFLLNITWLFSLLCFQMNNHLWWM
jgi:hypothetical protein